MFSAEASFSTWVWDPRLVRRMASGAIPHDDRGLSRAQQVAAHADSQITPPAKNVHRL